MNFKELLSTLVNRFGNYEFTSNDAYNLVGYGKISSQKVMSNRLAKLYFMGFLKRRRVKRSVIYEDKECNKGYCYIYSISSQGLKYLHYLANKSEHEKKDNDLLNVIKKVKNEDSNIIFAKIIKRLLEDCLHINSIPNDLVELYKKLLFINYIIEIVNENNLDINEKVQLNIILNRFLQ